MTMKTTKDNDNDKQWTAGRVREIIAAQWESDLPDRVIEALRPFDGKPITTRILAHMPSLPDGSAWRLVRKYGWTALETSSYATDAGCKNKTSINLILARTEASVPLDVRYVAGEVPIVGNNYGENSAYFAARRERNKKRLEAQNDAEICKRMADCLNSYQAALEHLASARSKFEKLADYSGNFEPDRYTLERLVDPDKKAKHQERQ